MSASRREEYSSSNVVRTLHPSRPLSPANTSGKLDNGLVDDLLDDLQTTVTRTAEHLNRSAKSRDMEYLSPSNTTTIVHERSISPALRDGNKAYKSSSYEYSSSSRSGGGTIDSRNLQTTNVNQLDSLLDDLKQERTIERDFSNVGIDDGFIEPNARTVKTTRTVTTSNSGPKSTSVLHSPTMVRKALNAQSRNRSRSPNYQSHVESQISRDVNYDSEPVPDTVLSSSQRSYNYSKTADSKKNTIPYNTDIVEVETTDFPKELRDVPLSSDILPQPGTKVTTTIKTFTYEIPGDTNVPTNKNFSYKNELYNSSNTSATTANQIYPERDIPPPGSNTLIYKTESHNTINRNGYPNGGPPASYPGPGGNQTYIYKKETNESTNNVYGRPVSPPAAHSTLIYQHDESNKTRNIHHPPPGGVQVYPYEPNNAHLPPHPGVKQTYLYKKESSNTTNTVYGAPGGPKYDPYPPVDHTGPPYEHPNDPTTAKYLYSSTSSHTTTNHGQPKEIISPFPTDGIPTQVDGNPPKHLNELLTSLGDNGVRFNDEPYTPRKEVNTALATNKPLAIVDPKPTSKNIAGPPVYYPPGKELFAKSEESAAWRAGGGYSKASGKYEYEAESKSKSSSKSGAAVVPVCLPLCCAMPCTIM